MNLQEIGSQPKDFFKELASEVNQTKTKNPFKS